MLLQILTAKYLRKPYSICKYVTTGECYYVANVDYFKFIKESDIVTEEPTTEEPTTEKMNGAGRNNKDYKYNKRWNRNKRISDKCHNKGYARGLFCG